MATIPHEKLGNLHSLTVIELNDLLRRQECILENKSFVGRLPDKGEKIRALAERIKEAVRGREKVDQTADLFEKMSLDADRSRQLPPAGENTHHDEEMEILGAIINREGGERTVIDERLVVDPKLANKSVENNIWNNVSCEDRFIPNRTLHVKSVGQLPSEELESLKKEEIVKEKAAPKKLISQDRPVSNAHVTSKLKYRYDEALEADITQHGKSHEAIKDIPIEEAIILQREQRKRLEEMRTKQAMERLAKGLHMKIGDYDAEGSRKMAYRQQEDEDSDDEPD